MVYPNDLKIGTPTQKLLHYTFIFQIFVFMQLFNQINARKIQYGEINVFKGFFNNCLFIFVTLLTFVVQMTMVEIGGRAIKTWPLNTQQNIICACVGAGELIWGLIIKFIPLQFFQCVSMDDQPMDEETAAKSSISQMKRSKLKFSSKQQEEIHDKLQQNI